MSLGIMLANRFPHILWWGPHYDNARPRLIIADDNAPFLLFSFPPEPAKKTASRDCRDGADDYLIKPFSARELLARVAAHLEIARLRRESEEALRQDITERKEFQAELEGLVAARTKSLQETTDQLNTFCYAIAHDLKAPVRTQVAFASLLLEEFSDRIGAEGSDYLKRMRDAAERQGRLINDLLSHMSLNRAELPLEPIELARAVEAARSDLHSEIQKNGEVIRTGGVSGKVMANDASLHLVLTNLLSNAVKFVAPGVPPEIDLWTQLRSDGSGNPFVRLIGIPEHSQDKIFGVFQRLHPRERYPGTGIGLAIVKKAVERMRGRVGVESQPGKGSRFWLELQVDAVAQSSGGNL
jgi:light-regulated signal transduction histidine kinase (bacteriophytochrome)